MLAIGGNRYRAFGPCGRGYQIKINSGLHFRPILLRRVSVDGHIYAAGTGNAVTDLIFSIAKRDVTFFSGTAPISFL